MDLVSQMDMQANLHYNLPLSGVEAQLLKHLFAYKQTFFVHVCLLSLYKPFLA